MGLPRSWTAIFTLGLLLLSGCYAKSLEVQVDSSGFFQILVEGATWFESGPIFVRYKEAQYSVGDGSLDIDSLDVWTGMDSIGVFEETSLTWNLVAENQPLGPRFKGNIRVYEEVVTFEQLWVDGANGTTSANPDNIISSFPSFVIKDSHAPSGHCQWTSWVYEFPSPYTSQSTAKEHPSVNSGSRLPAPGFPSPTCRHWDESLLAPGGIGGTGPSVIFNDDASTAFVLSAMTNVMAVNQANLGEGTIAYGVMGNVTSIPKGFSMKTILSLGNGVNEAMDSWGSALRSWNQKVDAATARKRDITLQYMGYNTDHGQYYYYTTLDHRTNYQDTMKAVSEYAKQEGLPFQYVLLDSWWYEHGEGDGVKNWSAVPTVFPGGMAGVYEDTQWLVQAHNRWWDTDNVYARQNGGDYEFLIDYERAGAVPMEQRFWDDFLADKQSWGLRVYEQDWLHNEFEEHVGAMLTDVTLGRQWLLQMGEGASKNGLTIQYCMPYSRHLLQSLEVDAVTQARASDDYLPGNDNWKIGGQNILMDALGLAPSKDGFWSTTHQPGNPYTLTNYHKEPYPELQAAVVTLTSGPVAPGDGIGYADKDLIMRSCTMSGQLLQPTYPAKLMDRIFSERTFEESSQQRMGLNRTSELWAATTVTAGRRSVHVFGAELNQHYSLSPRDMTYFLGGEIRQSFRQVDVRAVLAAAQENDFNSVKVKPFSAVDRMQLKACGWADFQLHVVLPVEVNGWSLLGEVDKWVGVATVRYLQISTTEDSMLVEVRGSPDEVITIGFISPDNQLVIQSCTVQELGAVKINHWFLHELTPNHTID